MAWGEGGDCTRPFAPRFCEGERDPACPAIPVWGVGFCVRG